MEFKSFGEIKRWSPLKLTITQKLHGSHGNITVFTNENGELDVRAGSRTRFLFPGPNTDNFGFAQFVQDNKAEIIEKLGIGTHYGEWVGCLYGNTPIKMADGGFMTISKLVNQKIPAEVLTLNLVTGKLEPKRIINWFKNGKTTNWLKVSIKRRRRGGKEFALRMTPNHIVFVKSGNLITEKMAGELTVDDKLIMPGNVLSYNIMQFLMGTLLGDGSFAEKRSISISHSDDDQPFYNQFIREKLSEIIISERKQKSGLGSNMIAFTTRSYPEIEDLFVELHTTPNKKTPTFNYLNKLSPLALAVWYMDDGSICKHNGENRQIKATLHVEGFGHDGVKVVHEWLNSRGFEANISTKMNGTKMASEIRFTPKGTIAFFNTIAPYVIPEFNYKLSSNFHNIPKIDWWNTISSSYELDMLEATIEKIEPFTPKIKNLEYKYDIQVEGNSNYFACNVLVHNSGINSGEGLKEKMFVLFNHNRPYPLGLPPKMALVPILYEGEPMNVQLTIDDVMEDLRVGGSVLVPGFMRTEGIVIELNGQRRKLVFEAEDTGWKGASKAKVPKVLKNELDYSYLCQPIRLEKLLSRDEVYIREYPKSLGSIVKDYVADLEKEGQLPTDPDECKAIKKNAAGQIFSFIKTVMKDVQV